MEPFGALRAMTTKANLLKDMVGPWGLEPQTSISRTFSDDCQTWYAVKVFGVGMESETLDLP
jgi:hypothetical protein